MKNLYNFPVIMGLMIFIQTATAQICPPLNVNLGNDTAICENGVLILDAGPGESYQWMDGKTERYYTVTLPGMYSVKVTDPCSKTDSDTINVALSVLPDFEIIKPAVKYFCKGERVNISSTLTFPAEYDLTWSSTEDKTNTTTVDTTGVYALTIKDIYGCTRTREVSLEFQYPYEQDSIQLVTYDVTEGKNIIIYSKTPSKRTKGFIMYNGLTPTNSLGWVEYKNTNLVVDQKTDPHLKSSYYNMNILDSCENQSEFRITRAHKTMFMQAVRNKITGATDIYWESYYGFPFQYYYILRGTEPENLEVIDSVKSDGIDLKFYRDNTDFDKDYFYQIGVKTPRPIFLENEGKKASPGPFIYSLSNLEDNRLKTGFNEPEFLRKNMRVYPNPADENTRLIFDLEAVANVEVSLFDITGRKIALVHHSEEHPGKITVPLNKALAGREPGIYLLGVEVDGTTIQTMKIIRK